MTRKLCKKGGKERIDRSKRSSLTEDDQFLALGVESCEAMRMASLRSYSYQGFPRYWEICSKEKLTLYHPSLKACA